MIPRSSQVIVIISAFIICSVLLGFIAYAKSECEDGDLEKCEKEIKKYEKKYESASKQLSDIRAKKNEVLSKISVYTSQLSVTQSEIDSLQADIDEMRARLDLLNQALNQKKESLAGKIFLRNKVVRDYYQQGIFNNFELVFAPSGGSSRSGFQSASFAYMFEKSLANEALRLIDILNAEIKNYESDKAEAEALKNELETTQNNLVSLKRQLDEQKVAAESTQKQLAEKEGDAAEELASLQEKIDRLTRLQQQLLAEKGGEGIISGYEPPAYKLPDPPFTPAFALMSYGAYTHYNGMSQYGAKGRAAGGQGYEDIIKFYFGEGVKEKDDFPGEIRVAGFGEMDFQTYLYGLAEMPSSWPSAALKAQAVAARSYAYRYAKAQKEICTTQSCQVFSKGKSDDPPDSWREAVDETKNEIIDGSTDAAGYGWYSSTTGGYVNNVGWDSDGGWPGGAYEKKAGSPWFYKAWYTQSYRDDSGKCGRSTPWLSEDEMADILNAWVVWKKGNGGDRDRISPVTTSCWDGDPYSHGEMRERADELGDVYTDIGDTWVDIGNNGRTAQIHFRTNAGTVNIDGDEFRTVFNLRAPGYVSVRNRLFGVEHRD